MSAPTINSEIRHQRLDFRLIHLGAGQRNRELPACCRLAQGIEIDEEIHVVMVDAAAVDDGLHEVRRGAMRPHGQDDLHLEDAGAWYAGLIGEAVVALRVGPRPAG